MAEGHHDQLSELFEQAVELSPEKRRQFLESCTDDPAIRAELRSLLAAHDRAPNLLERLADEVLPPALQAVADDHRVNAPTGNPAQPIVSTPERSGGAAVAIDPGARMGAYEIQGRIAAGGIGVVYRAFDTVLQRSVAIKTLAWSAPDARAALLREARAASALNHPHICTIHEVGEQEGVPFIAMEYIDGRTLRDLIPPDGLPGESILRYGVQVAQAVEYAHRHGLIHRDLKSANVMVSAEGHVKVLDFGLASRIPSAEMETVTRTRGAAANGGPLAGTLAYLAPELLRGSAADRRSDIWALGVLLYEMAAGRLPFQGTTPFEITAAILNGTPSALPATLPMPLQSVIGRCLARDPARRYRDAGELRVALETVQLGSDPSMAGRDESRGAVRRPPPWRRPLLIAGVTALALAGAVAVMLFNAKRSLALTDRDTLLVADFVNTTGDSVFDQTLKQALSIHLEQSPFLSVVSREEERATLRLMTKSPDDRLAGAVAREACQRIGAKAMIEGTIAAVGSHYAIGLDALNCQSGATIGSEQAEASNREQVLTVLGAAASRLRRKLGESLPTVQRFDKPLEQATTSSLEAFQAFSAGEDIRSRTSELGAVPFYLRAIELDPDFALAYARLSAVYWTLGQAAKGSRNAEEAYARRDRVSERERFYIDGQHCGLTADPDCGRNVYELWKRTYPRDGRPHGNLSNAYYGALMCDKALENAQESLRLDPGYSQPYAYVARSYLCLEKPAEARQTLEQALSRHLESPFIYIILFRVAFYERDDRAIERVRAWASGQPEESLFKQFESDAAAVNGQMRRSRELRLQAERLAAVRLMESVLPARARGAVYEAAQGNFQRARDSVKSIAVESPPASVIPLLVTAAVLARDDEQADVLSQGRSGALNQGPAGLLDAVVRVLREVAAGDRSAISQLPPASPRELTGGLQSFYPAYVRGLAYLLAGDGGDAAAEFQRILDHRGVEPMSPLYPLAFVQQARAYVLMGEHNKARKAYQEFLALWKDADPDIPILREAKAEYARLPAR